MIRDVQCTFSLNSGTFDANGKKVSILFTQLLKINGAFTFDTLDLWSAGEYCQLNSDIVCNVFSMNGYSTFGNFNMGHLNRILVRSDIQGVSRTITASEVLCKYVDFQDINAAGTANWNLSSIKGGSGNCEGNTGITFTPSKNVYWFRNSGSWSDTTKWSSQSGGFGTKNLFPLPQDTAIFDAASFSVASQTITTDVYRISTVKMNNTTKPPNWNCTRFINVFGSIQIDAPISIYGSSFVFSKRSTQYFKTSGSILNQDIIINSINGKVILEDDLNILSTKNLNLTNGTLDANNKNILAGTLISSNSNVRTLLMGNGTWTLSGRDIITHTWALNNPTNLILDADSSTIIINGTNAAQRTFHGGGLQYNVVSFSGNNGFIQGNNSFDSLIINNSSHPFGLKFLSGTTQTVNNFISTATIPSLCKIQSTSNGNKFTLFKSSGTVSVDYISIKDSEAIGGAAWNAGSNSINVSGNSGWIF